MYKVYIYTVSNKVTLDTEGQEGELCIARNLSATEKHHLCSAIVQDATHSDTYKGGASYWTIINYSSDEYLVIDVCLHKSCNGHLIGDLCSGMINSLLNCQTLYSIRFILQIDCGQIVMMNKLVLQLVKLLA